MTMPHIKKSAQTTENRILIRVLGGHQAPLTLYQQIERQVSSRMQTIIDGQLYTLKIIIGEALWGTLPNNQMKRMAGRCFAHMVSVGRFPFRFVQYKRYCTKRYQLK